MADTVTLGRVREMLNMAKLGLDDIVSGDPTRRRPGVMNLAVWGRAVTNVLQGLRSSEPAFDEWYEPHVRKMQEDPLMRYFYKLRSRALKEGELQTGSHTYISEYTGIDEARLWANAPPGAETIFFGDRLGGNGFVVRMPDGSTEEFYFEMPPDIALLSQLQLEDAPTEHDGSPIPDASVETLGRLYFEALARLVDEALERFGG